MAKARRSIVCELFMSTTENHKPNKHTTLIPLSLARSTYSRMSIVARFDDPPTLDVIFPEDGDRWDQFFLCQTLVLGNTDATDRLCGEPFHVGVFITAGPEDNQRVALTFWPRYQLEQTQPVFLDDHALNEHLQNVRQLEDHLVERYFTQFQFRIYNSTTGVTVRARLSPSLETDSEFAARNDDAEYSQNLVLYKHEYASLIQQRRCEIRGTSATISTNLCRAIIQKPLPTVLANLIDKYTHIVPFIEILIDFN